MDESNKGGGRDTAALWLNIYIFCSVRTLNLVGIKNYLCFPASSLARCVTLGKLLHLSETQSSYSYNGDNNT